LEYVLVKSRTMPTGGAQYRAKLDWQNRTGKFIKYSRDRSIAYVIWEGIRTFDRVSVNLIEAADRALLTKNVTNENGPPS